MDKKTYDEIGVQLDALPLPINGDERQAYSKAWSAIVEQGGWTIEEWEAENERRIDLALERIRLYRDNAANASQLDKHIDLP